MSLATSINNVGTKFIKNMFDWTSTDSSKNARITKWSQPDGSSVCPANYRVPTQAEFENEVDWASTGIENVTDIFNTFFKLGATGFRRAFHATMLNQGSSANYWTTNTKDDSNSAYTMNISTYQIFSPFGVASGLPIRCIKE